MESVWAQRIAEGLVVGVSVSVTLLVFNAMNDARVELTAARETLEIQVNVNQDLLDKTESLERQIKQLLSRSEPRPLFGEYEIDGDLNMPTESADPNMEFIKPTETPESARHLELMPEVVVLPVSNNGIQERINQQRALTQ